MMKLISLHNHQNILVKRTNIIYIRANIKDDMSTLKDRGKKTV